jgi:YYY domain-containing protein
MLFLGNLEGFLEFLYLRKVGWGPNQTYTDAEGVLHSRFWDFLNIKDLINAPNLESADLALRFWWWWRGSRVIHDFNFAGNEVEVIDEFPFFSLLLADLHPHVLVIPFALLGTALALAVFLGAGQPDAEGSWLKRPMLFFDLDRGTFLVGALIYGGLAFLNIWDFPLYVGLFAGAYLLRKGAREGWRWNYIGEFFSLGVTFGIVGVLLYLPYYIGFSSQAGGILPNVINPSRGVQLWVMFGILWLPIFGYLIWTWARRGLGRNLGIGILTAFLVAAALWVVSLGLVWVIVGLSPSLAGLSPSLAQAGLDWLHSTGAPSLNEFLALGTSRRLGALPGTLTLVVLVGLTLGLLWPRGEKPESKPEPARQFLALLALFATLLVLVPEFVYLRDNFGTRMNTVFKFYYQAWLLWAVAAAVGAAMVISSAKAIGRWVFIVVLAIAVGLGSFYPAMAVNEKVSQFTDRPEPQLSLDGNAHFSYLSPDEHALVDFLRNEPLGPLVEAVGGSYTGYARIATFSGQPNLLGWPGHEGQWRGGGEEMGSRAGDIQRIYESSNWDETQALLAQYQVSYVVIAPLEMNTYAVNQAKFERNLAKIFEQGGVALYLVPSFQSSGLPTP